MRRWWIAIGGGIVMALGALLSALAASAQSRPPVTVQLVGSLTIVWQGNQTSGCAAEGLCGVSGSLQMLPGGSGSSSPGPPPLEVSDQNAVARVTELSAGGATENTCADLVPVDFTFGLVHSGGGLHAALNRATSAQLPSAGRCAGPTAGDLSALTLPARKLGGRGYDLSGKTSFVAGPFTVTAISTVRAVFSHGVSGILGIGASSTITTTAIPLKPPTRLQEHAEVDYHITGQKGALTTTFAGLATPLCAPLGACGAAGSVSESFIAGGVLGFFATRFVKHHVGRRGALADLRAGRLQMANGFQGTPLEETAIATVSGPGLPTCSDRRTEGPFAMQSNATRKHAIEVKLAGGEPFSFFGTGGPDPLRTRCPGPSAADVLGRSALAAGSLPVSALGARRLTLTFGADGSFTSSAYAGKRSGSLVLSLALKRASGGTYRQPGFPRAPVARSQP